jgi:hypothetical protein
MIVTPLSGEFRSQESEFRIAMSSNTTPSSNEVLLTPEF